jgi:(2R)-3-sulfolactate dehydrogenase (NADP+)
MRLALAEAESLAAAALQACDCSAPAASVTARALVAAEAAGQAGHGLSRVPSYALQARARKVDGHAVPALERLSPVAVRVDAANGFAYPAIDLAIEALAADAARGGIAVAALHRSHHVGQAGLHVERLADRGLVALLFANTPKAMALHGGAQPMLGTNPLAFAAPVPGAPALVIDLALAVAARGKIVAAQKAGREIPEGWAVDRAGRATTDPAAALEGSLLPIGGAKGGALALMIEVLAAAVAGGAWGWEASSFFDDRGGPPGMAHLLLALDPQRLSGGAYASRMTGLLAAFAAEPTARLPGTRRLECRARADREGIELPAALHSEIAALCAAH